MCKKENLISRLLSKFPNHEGLDDLLPMCDHWDGYKRENAVRRLGMLGSPLSIPQLIVRANDWVPQVRSAAKEAILKLATSNNAEAFIYCLPELYHLKNCGRDNHNELIIHIEKFLLSKENVAYIKFGLHNKNPFVVRLCMELIIKNKLIEPTVLVKNWLTHPDLIVRMKVSNLLSGLEGDDLFLALSNAVKDNYMPIRRKAFSMLLQNDFCNIQVEEFLFDKHAAIREIALKYLQKIGVDVKSIYLNKLDSSRPFCVCCALWGIAILNGKENIGKVKALLQSPYPVIRKSAINALSKLMGYDAREILVSGIMDDSPAVCKESARLAKGIGFSFTSDDLLRIINQSNFSHNAKSCVGISRRINKWDRLLFFLNLLNEEYVNKLNDLQLIEAEIKQWNFDFNRSYIQPTEEQRTLLLRKCREFSDLLESSDYRCIVFTLNSVGIAVR